MSNDDLLLRHGQRLFARAGQVSVSQACRELGFHRSTYYRWRGRVEREGLEFLRPRERRRPRMPFAATWNTTSTTTTQLGPSSHRTEKQRPAARLGSLRF